MEGLAYICKHSLLFLFVLRISSNSESIDLVSDGDYEIFDAKKHLSFIAPDKIYSMDDIKLGNKGVSPVAVSEPFQLFTPEAVKHMRAEIFKEDVMAKYRYSSNLSKAQLRGYAAR